MNEIASFVDGDIGDQIIGETVESRRLSITSIISISRTITNFISKFNMSGKSKNTISVNNPPYAINNAGKELPLFTRTAPMDAFHHGGIIEYDAHNLFGHMEAIVTHRALRTIYPEKR